MAMKTARLLIALACFIVLIIPAPSHATSDTDVYNISTNVKPNVLIIFDNSISMGSEQPYEDSASYSGSYVSTTNYQRSCTTWNWSHTVCRTFSSWSVYTGTFNDTSVPKDGKDDSSYPLGPDYCQRGNRINYDTNPPASKISAAKSVTKSIIDATYQYARLGIMTLNGSVSCFGVPADYHKDNTVLSSTYGGSQIQEWTSSSKETLKGYVNNLSNLGATPLAVRLINAAQYFKHANSTTFGNFGKDNFDDPISSTYWCRKNYVIIVTDGMPTWEGNTDSVDDDTAAEFSNYIGAWFTSNGVSADYDGDGVDPDSAYFNSNPANAPYGGSHYLDDVAKYLYDTNLRPEITQGKQNITTYTIGFTVDDPFLQRVADSSHGHGDYYTANTAAELEDALRNAMATIIDRAQTFTAPVVPIQRTTSGDKMYISLFTPKSGTEKFWPGYLVKLKIGNNGELIGFSENYGIHGGHTEVQVTDSNGALNEDLLKSDRSPYPYWDAQHELLIRTSARNIYTYLGNADLNATSNKFDDAHITVQMLDNPTKQASAATGPTAKQDLINYISGYDPYDENGNTVRDEKREYILGDILHSKPLIIDYASNPTNPQRVIYVGTNDGMLHAFDDTNGSEKWAFIPPDLLPTLKNIVEGSGHQYYVDGSPQVYIKDVDHDGNIDSGDGDKVIIIFGERKGGTSYCALDVTNPDDPQYLWRIDKVNNAATYNIPAPTTVISELGQTWSDPAIGKVKVVTTDTIVAIVGGGYTDNNSAGRAVYLINVLNGTLVKSFTSPTYSIPSAVLAVDTNLDSYIDRVYVGDLGGQMWRFGLQRANAGDTRLEDGNVENWTARKLFASTLTGAKIFYPPDMVLEPGYAYLYFGTGNREDPMAMTGVTNRFYAVKDKNKTDADFPTLGLGDGNLINLTADLIQESPSQAPTILASLTAADGWYINLENTGEKVLAPPTVILGMLLFTTFTPVDTVANPCSYGGDARLYALDYLTAAAVLDFNGDGNLGKSDVSKKIGQGIPTEVVITLTETGQTRAYIGAGQGIVEIDLTATVKAFYLDAWREAF
jgi:type IV pilus assembly protein PilY1